MRMANGARVIPVGTLLGVGTWIGGIEFPSNYLVIKPSKPFGYPVLPWLYEEAESYEDEVYLMQYLNALTEEEVFSDRYNTNEVVVNLRIFYNCSTPSEY
ncbi:unnamed protein product [Calypogeia fissa]